MSTDQSPAEAPRPRRDRPARTEAAEATEATEALGGAPIPVPHPPMAARRIERPDRPAPSASDSATAPSNAPARAANPLFDAPDDDGKKAALAIQAARKALGRAARAIEEAVSLVDALPAGDALAAAATRESFDLDQAKAVRDELAAFLDRHKPVERN